MIQIQVTGILQLDNKTKVLNPLVTIETALDNYLSSTVDTTSLFTSENQNYQLSRDTGSFDYTETWTDEDVEKHLKNWINGHRAI